MQVTGVENKRSTPESRKRKRDNAVKFGDAELLLTSQPVLISGFVAGILLAGYLEKLSL